MEYSYITDPNNMAWKGLLKSNNGKYANVFGAFDIETSNVLVMDDGEVDTAKSFALPYTFQIGFGTVEGAKIFYLLRTPDEFVTLMRNVSENVEKPICFFIHNAGFEFEHVKFYLSQIGDLQPDGFFFNNSKRRILYFRVGNIEFRDSYQLTNMSLAKVGETLKEKGVVDILKGEMDYAPIRTPKTPLTDEEVAYMIQDVNILLELWKDELSVYGSPSKLPLTNTGKVRKQTQAHMRSHTSDLKRIKKIEPSFLAMETNRQAFYGGYTHANRFQCYKVHEDVVCFDIASAHPTAMLIKKFPMGKVGRSTVSHIDDLEKLYKDGYNFWGRFVFYNIETEDVNPAIYDSTNTKAEGAQWANGKLLRADKVEISLLDLDFFHIAKHYDYEKVGIMGGFVYISKSDYLPEPLREFIYEQYWKKTAYKNVKGKEEEYMLSKININSVFGMCAMDPIRECYIMDLDKMEVLRTAPYTGTKYEGLPPSSAYELSSKDKKLEKCYISELWGAYITMYSRLRVFELIEKVGSRFIYCDTDSVYYSQDGLNEDGREEILREVEHINKGIFEEYTRAFSEKLLTLSDSYTNDYGDVFECGEHQELPEYLLPPKDPSGKSRPIGIWAFDGSYSKFGTRGAKSYLTLSEDGEKWKLTHSGLPKSAVVVFSRESDPYESFLNPAGFSIPAAEGFHKSKIYQHEALEGDIVDYLGNTYHYTVPSSLVIYNSDYSTNKFSEVFSKKQLTFHSANGTIKA